ncbi:hypothetical protein [Streptomyces sp. NPDC048172]|uniref:hypothetical protein n=1 Tax=Streptomyces sp. NPDC048172 TaxID=3365505 RepID=UPI0037122914
MDFDHYACIEDLAERREAVAADLEAEGRATRNSDYQDAADFLRALNDRDRD